MNAPRRLGSKDNEAGKAPRTERSDRGGSALTHCCKARNTGNAMPRDACQPAKPRRNIAEDRLIPKLGVA